MSIVRKVRAVEKLFKTLEKDIQSLQSQIQISCIENCIKCCTTPKIVATSLEFYPLAYHLFKTGQAELYLAKIEQNSNNAICPLLNNLVLPDQRLGCGQYNQRGMICRLFAYNYNVNKYGQRRIAACKPIMLAQPEEVSKANELLAIKPIGPKASDYYSQLRYIDFWKGSQLYPIAQAIQIAIETILTDSRYRGKKAG
jgi:Fe-S-cluster containining protein